MAKSGFHPLGTHSRETLKETRGWGGARQRTHLAGWSRPWPGREELEGHPSEELGLVRGAGHVETPLQGETG